MRTLNGAWSYSWQGELTDRFAGDFNTIYESLQNNYGRNNVKYVSGVSYRENGNYYDMVEDNISLAVREAKNSDYVVLCLGENTYTEKPGDLNDLNIHKLQRKLAIELSKTHDVLVLADQHDKKNDSYYDLKYEKNIRIKRISGIKFFRKRKKLSCFF